MKTSAGLILITILTSFLSGCKSKTIDFLTYELNKNNEVCAIKPTDIKEADMVSMFDGSFKSIDGKFNEKLSEITYKQSLINLADTHNNYLFCIPKSSFNGNFLESQIRVEIKKGKYLKQYEFINYFCIKNNIISNYKDLDRAKKMCF